MVFGFLLLFQVPIVQQKLADKFSDWINTEYGISMKTQKLKIGLLSGLVWEDILIEGTRKDTLFFVEEINITTTDLAFNHFNKIYIKGLRLNYIYSDSIQDAEFFRLLNPLLAKSESKSSLKIDNIWVNGAALTFGKADDVKYFSNINVYLKEIALADETHFALSNLSWDVKNGAAHTINAKSFKSDVLGTEINGFNWKSGTSEIDVNFSHSSHNDSSSLSINTFKVNKLATNGLFSAWPSSLELQAEAVLSLVNDQLSTKDFRVSTSNGSTINGDLQLSNIRNFKQWKYKLHSPTLNINKREWDWLEPLFEYNYLLKSLGNINANLSLEGTQTEVDLQMELSSNEGYLSTDVSINKTDSTKASFYEGTILLSEFNLAAIVSDYQVSTINANLSVKGSGFDLLSFDTDITGEISSIEVGDYQYENINLNGRLQPNYFKGEAFVKDENLEVDFSGEVDFSKPKPLMDFTADIIKANIKQLSGREETSITRLSTLLEMNLEGDDLSNIEGSLAAYFTTLETDDNYYHFNDLKFHSSKSTTGDTLTIFSDFVNAQLDGQIDIPNLYNSILAYLAPHLPLLPKAIAKPQNFNFDVDILNSNPITELFMPQLHLGYGAHANGVFNTKQSGLNLNITCPNLGWGDWIWHDLSIASKATSEHWEVDLLGLKLDYKQQTKFENIEIDQIGAFGDWRYALAWSSNDSIKFDGIVKGNANIKSNSLDFDLEESQFYLADTLWTLNKKSSIYYHTNGNINTNILLNTANQTIDFSYVKSKLLDEVSLTVNDFEFENINPWLSKNKSSLIGQLSGEMKVSDFSSEPKISSSIFTNDLVFNNYPFGEVELTVSYDEELASQLISGEVFSGINKTIDVSGTYLTTTDSNNFKLDLNVHDFKLNHLETYLSKVFSELGGTGIGHFSIYGNLNNPQFDGELFIDDVFIAVPYLDVEFQTLKESKVVLSDRHIEFVDFDFVGSENENYIGKANLSGEILHHTFKDFYLDLNLNADSLLCLNTDAYRDEAYYGRALATGDAKFSGDLTAIDIAINARTNSGTSLYIPLDDKESIDELSFVHFIEKDELKNDTLWTLSEVIASKTGLLIDMNFEITEEAVVNIIFDETLGDKITAKGSGFINLGVNEADEVYMFGEYNLSQGDYLFTLQNFVNKKFEIENGAQLNWDGNPYTAQMELTALYSVNTNISGLSAEYNRKTDVECSMHMSGELLQPTISFGIQIPKGDDLINRILDERTNTEEKKTQQFLSLLVLNSFMSTDELQNTNVDYLSTTLSTGTEVLSNQLSNWMSQFTDKFDLGFKYHPNQGDTLSNKEFELLMNNMKVNDRITFNGNIGTLPAQNTTRFIGDFKVEYQINEDGKLKLLAFRNLEESFLLQDGTSNYTTGVGLYYRDEFDDFTDMWHKFLGMFKRNKSN